MRTCPPHGMGQLVQKRNGNYGSKPICFEVVAQLMRPRRFTRRLNGWKQTNPTKPPMMAITPTIPTSVKR